MRNLRERLEEEHTALLAREADKTVLEARVARLTRLVLHSTRAQAAHSQAAARVRRSYGPAASDTVRAACNAPK